MSIIRAQTILHTTDAVPENYVTNSWAFQLLSTSGSGALLTPLIKAFYDTVRPYLSQNIAQNGHEIKYSELPGTPPKDPYDLDIFNLTTAPAGGMLPDEVALALSFEGTKAAGLPQARRRGRIFVGPLNAAAATQNRPSSAFITAMVTAGTNLKANTLGIGAGSFVPTNNGWVDNAFDTQRRRGVLSTSRGVFA